MPIVSFARCFKCAKPISRPCNGRKRADRGPLRHHDDFPKRLFANDFPKRLAQRRKTMPTPYLFFDGRCEEAIEFYKKALGAEVKMMMRYKESPEPPPPGMVAPGSDNKIMHSCLANNGEDVMVADRFGVGWMIIVEA